MTRSTSEGCSNTEAFAARLTAFVTEMFLNGDVGTPRCCRVSVCWLSMPIGVVLLCVSSTGASETFSLFPADSVPDSVPPADVDTPKHLYVFVMVSAFPTQLWRPPELGTTEFAGRRVLACGTCPGRAQVHTSSFAW